MTLPGLQEFLDANGAKDGSMESICYCRAWAAATAGHWGKSVLESPEYQQAQADKNARLRAMVDAMRDPK